MEISKILAGVPLFSGLTEAQYRDLAAIVVDRTFARGNSIFSEGDEGTGCYLVVKGRVKIYKLSPEGKEQILHLWGPGEPFGEAALFAGRNFPAHADAYEESRVFFFPRKAFANLIKANPSLALNMLATLSMRLHRFASLIEDLSLKEVPGRLAAYLLELSRTQDESDRVTLDLAKSQVANLLGTIPETMSRMLAMMVKQGLIKSDGPRIEILDREGLEALAVAEKRLSDFTSA
ncbi:MAG: Crp/Fnr family transcriptional regulator [Deltaproteobacteria bacterium]|nr:Crp/Fnr family transcriptional regulator [Deltaproteobacteria bacterium]